MAYNILVVEDSDRIRETIGDFFAAKSGGTMQLSFAEDGDRGLDMLYEHEYDLVLLDIVLPGTSGFELCRELRTNSGCPIIFLTALGTESDILHGYELGADDYAVKLFSLAALYAKALALIKRSKGMVRGSDAHGENEGSGIGLAIARADLERLGFRLRIEAAEIFTAECVFSAKEAD